MEHPTATLRHVWRDINDGNEDLKVLIVQQWIYRDINDDPNHGFWKDLEVTTEEPDTSQTE